jgi:hypothetical protein
MKNRTNNNSKRLLKGSIRNTFLFISTASILLSVIFGCSKQKKKVVPKSPVCIRSVPEKVNINLISHNRKLGTTPWQANLVKGMYVFEFTKPGYQTTWKKISTNPPSREDLEIKMKPITAAVIIKTEPPGATLSSGKRIIGQTPIAMQNIPLGAHTYSLSKPGCSPREITVLIEDERPQIISENMKSNIGSLTVKTNPADANIFLNDVPRGKTPAVLKIERGDYNLRIQLPGYSIHKEKVSVLSGKISNVNVNLQELPGSIKVVTVPENSTLMVNGKQYNNTPTTLKNLKPGDYEILVAHDKYDTTTRKVSLAAGQDLTVNISLDTNMGGIDLIVHPPGVTVYVDGKKMGLTQEGETKDLSKIFEVRNLKSGIHTVTLAHKRAQPSIKKLKIEIKKGQIRRPKQIRFWIKDTYLKLNDGREFTGRIAQENKDEILFEPDPTMKIRYAREDIEVLRALKEGE